MFQRKPVLVLALAAGLLLAVVAYGGEYTGIAALKSYKHSGNAIDFVCISERNEDVFVRIDICTADMLRVRYGSSQIQPRQENVVVKGDWDRVDFRLSEQKGRILIETGRLRLSVEKRPFRLAIYDKDGNVILRESPAGMRRTKAKVSAFMRLDSSEHFFGFGAAAGIGGRMGFEGQFFNRLDKRNQKINIVGRRVAFFMSTKGYGIFLNSLYPYNSIFRMGSDRGDVYSFETNDKQLDYYFLYGPGFKHILGRYTELTGRTPLIPKWGFGTRQAGYWDQGQVEIYAAEYRKRKIPCDVIHVDSTWLDKGAKYEGRGIKPYKKGNRGYVDFKWDNRQFPEPADMISKLAEAGFKFTLWETALVNPNVGEFYDKAQRQGYFVKDKDGSTCLVRYGKRGQTAVPDFSNPAAAKWWKQQHKPLVDIGVKSFKLDHTGDLGTATQAVFYNGWNLQQMRLLHRLLNLKTVFEAVAQYTKGRGMIWSSIASAGTQRYPITWCGDYRLTFEGLQEVIKSMQNMGLSGFGYYAPDIAAKRNIKDGHLYVRWAQFGLMNPVCQSWTVLPWDFGPEVESSYRYYAGLHYRLVPYIYSCARIANQTGVPICRAMVLEFQDDPKVYEQDLQYFFGPALLVAPVCTEQDTRRIYLPAGRWFDYNTGEVFAGPKTIQYHSPLERIPIFVKAGAIIPMAPEMNYVGERPTDPLTLDVYPAGTTSFTLYEDDGTSYEYEKGSFALTVFASSQAGDGITIDIGKSKGRFEVPDRSYVLKINGVCAAVKVEADDKPLEQYSSKGQFDTAETGWRYEPSRRILWVKLPAVASKDGVRLWLEGCRVLE